MTIPSASSMDPVSTRMTTVGAATGSISVKVCCCVPTSEPFTTDDMSITTVSLDSLGPSVIPVRTNDAPVAHAGMSMDATPV